MNKPILFMGLSPIIFMVFWFFVLFLIIIFVINGLYVLLPVLFGAIAFFLKKLHAISKKERDFMEVYFTIEPKTKQVYEDEEKIFKYLLNKNE